MSHRAPYDPRHASRPRYPYRPTAPPLVLELSPDDPCLLQDLPAATDRDERAQEPYDIVLGSEGTD